MRLHQTILFVLLSSISLNATGSDTNDLPERYFFLLDAWSAQIEKRLDATPNADLKTLEAQPGSRHFPYTILAPAVLYAKQHRQNPRYRDPKMLALAIRIGDLLASEHERGAFEPRLDSDWDTYMWLEAYRLLERELGAERRARWKRAIEENVALYVEDATDRLDFPWYNSPYIGTSPNHYSLWAANLLVAGRVFGKKDWEALGVKILRRYATVEQTADGYWGEHSRSGPTIGYNHLTLSAVALYWEYTKDPAALGALRRATDFHEFFTWPNGEVVEVINDRNRHWEVSAWSHFAFSHFPDGRRYAEFLTGFFQPDNLKIDAMGRLAQNTLYFHEGPKQPIPQDRPQYAHQMNIAAGIRKTGPWTVALSGIIDTQAINSQYYLDRQGNVSVFHEKLGLIISGANSKRQPELATFSEKLMGQTVHIPLSSRLQMNNERDRLSVAFNTFFSDLYVTPPTDNELSLDFVISGRGRPADDPQLTLQLCLKPGQLLETGAGRKIMIGAERIALEGPELGRVIRHQGWSLKVDESARLVWPVFPHNPYTNAPETDLKYAVAALSVPLRLKSVPGRYVRAKEQEILFVLRAN